MGRKLPVAMAFEAGAIRGSCSVRHADERWMTASTDALRVTASPTFGAVICRPSESHQPPAHSPLRPFDTPQREGARNAQVPM